MHLKPFTIYDSLDYFETLTTLVAKTNPGSRVALMSMSFDPDNPHIDLLVRELIAAAKRGVQVYLLIDAFSFSLDKRQLPTGPVILLRPEATARHPYFRQKYLLLEQLRINGGHYHIINYPAKRLSNPYAGRSHIKLAVVDDIVFTGGCNLDVLQIDFMTRFEDETTATWLYALVAQIAEYGSVREALHDTDQTFAIDERTTLLVDAGKPKQSLIYEDALGFIDAARDWLVVTCQFFPSTVTAKHLAAAVARGVHVTLYYNHPRHHPIHIRPAHHATILAEKTRQPRTLFAHQLPRESRRLHAKLLLSEQGAIIGSHNYVIHGVNFGTAEIAIRHYDPGFPYEALQLLKQYLPTGYADTLPNLSAS